ncbi:unnamed protein product [Sphagnum tenellum]
MLIGLGSAFAFKAPERRQTNDYWQYNGGSTTSPSSYSETSGIPCSGTSAICEISAPANGNVPQISNALKTRIENLDTSDGDVFLHD